MKIQNEKTFHWSLIVFMFPCVWTVPSLAMDDAKQMYAAGIDRSNYLQKQKDIDDVELIYKEAQKGCEYLSGCLRRFNLAVNKGDFSGKTALHLACERRDKKAIYVLLSCEETDIDKKDVNGKTPREIAAEGGITLREIRLVADYDCYPLWEILANDIGNINYRDKSNKFKINISDDLKDRLDRWADRYDKTLDADNPVASGFLSKGDQQEFQKEGEEMLTVLKNELQQNDFLSENAVIYKIYYAKEVAE